MPINARISYSPVGNCWNLFSAGAFEGGSDPGVPQAEDGDNDLPPIESSDGDENIFDMSSNEGLDQNIGNTAPEEDSTSAFLGGNDRRTK